MDPGCRPDHWFFFNDTATTEIYTLSLHDALPISSGASASSSPTSSRTKDAPARNRGEDRKSTRLNSSHITSSYAVFCLKTREDRTPPPPLAPRRRAGVVVAAAAAAY